MDPFILNLGIRWLPAVDAAIFGKVLQMSAKIKLQQ
jgi:hypothetical protein